MQEFEELKTNQKLVIENLSKFLDCNLSDDKVNQLVEHLKFENMKNNKEICNQKVMRFDQ